MPKINVRKAHNTTLDDAKAKTHTMLDMYREKNASLFSDIKWSADGSSAQVIGPMFKGSFTVTDRDVNVLIDLKLVATPFKGKVENGLQRTLDKTFG